MLNQQDRHRTVVRWMGSHWLVITIAILTMALGLFTLAGGQPVQAASEVEFNQTVPPPTPRPPAEPTKPTPAPDNNDNNDDDNNDDDNNAGGAYTPAPAQPATGDKPAAPAAAAPDGLTAVVQALTLNVRQGPGTSFPVVGKLRQDTVVTVLGRNQAGDWWSICCVPDTTTPGWVSASFLTPNFAADLAAGLPVVGASVAVATPAPALTSTVATIDAAATPLPDGIPGAVTALTLNVRRGPGVNNPVVGKIRQDQGISVLGRNATGDWLYICCLTGAQPNGWVSAQYITPTFTLADLPEAAVSAPATPEATPAPVTPTETVTNTTAAATVTPEAADPAAAPAGDTTLTVGIEQRPPFAVQGKEIALIFTIANTDETTANNVVLRSELPAVLTLADVTASLAGEISQETGADGAAVVVVTWPAVEAGATATVNARVTVAADAPNGAVYDNLAAVSAENALDSSAGITIGMPPSMLPEFW